MKYFISADMEGIAGAVSWKEYEDEYARYRRIFTAEVGAVCEGILETNPRSQIVICDAHGSGQNLLIEELPETVLLSRGNGRPPLGPGADPGAQALAPRAAEADLDRGAGAADVGARAILAARHPLRSREELVGDRVAEAERIPVAGKGKGDGGGLELSADGDRGGGSRGHATEIPAGGPSRKRDRLTLHQSARISPQH